MIVRPVQRADLLKIVHIEQQAMPDPWDLAQMRAETEVNNSVALVVEDDSLLCGYAFFRVCHPECELLRFVIAPEWQRRGLGIFLLSEAFAAFARQGYTHCFLEVRASNGAAQYFYKQAGFTLTGCRKKYYHQPVEDAFVFCGHLDDSK